LIKPDCMGYLHIVRKLQLFIPCFIDQLFPEAGLSVYRVFKRLGWEPVFPEKQVCCGQPFFNSGYLPQARKVARNWLRSFNNDTPIVCPSGSCTSMVRLHYRELFTDGPEGEKARDLSGNIFEFTEFIVEYLRIEDLGARFPGRGAYHPSCHQVRELKKPGPAVRLLSHVKELQLVDYEGMDECCGFGGTFAIKFPELSEKMGRDKLESLRRSGAEFLVSTDLSCLMHLEGLARKINYELKFYHIAQLLEGK